MQAGSLLLNFKTRSPPASMPMPKGGTKITGASSAISKINTAQHDCHARFGFGLAIAAAAACSPLPGVLCFVKRECIWEYLGPCPPANFIAVLLPV